MAEYIEREAVEKFIEKGLNNPDKSKAYGFDAVEILSEVHFMPAADVAEVKHGWWIGRPLCGNSNCRCSICGSWWNVHANLNGEINQKYCPNCGARMDGKGE